ncbi:MAG: hypothetical protein QGG54_09120, partial [Gammaproteobacteria bacterium]|nr:hypothetical protein [Gammaproteobacteria bacterium]
EERASYLDLTYDGEDIKIKGMTIVSGVVYMADSEEDQILKASIPTGETTTPLALTNDGTHLWAVTDGTGGADTLLQLNASTGAKVNGFTMEVDDVTGITHDGDDLWVLVSTQNGCSMQKIDPSDGSNDGQSVTMTQGWCNGYGGISHDGDDFWVVQQSQNRVESYDDNGNSQADNNVDQWSGGGRAIAINSSGQFWVARGSDIDAFTAGNQNMQQVSGMQQEDLEITAGVDLDVAGMTWMGSVLYIADDETDTIYKTAAPAGSNDLLGMTTDGTDLYLLMNNSPQDSVMKVDTNGSKVTAWGTDGVINLDYSDVHGIAVFENQLWVAELSQNWGSAWAFQGYSVADGSTVDDFQYNNVPMGQSTVKGLATDGEYLIVGHTSMQGCCGPGSGGGLIKFDSNGNDQNDNIDLSDSANNLSALAYRDYSPEVVMALNDTITTYSSDGTYSDEYELGGSYEIVGLTAIGYTLYIGDSDSNSVKIASVPLPTTTITTEPKAMAVDGSDMFIVVEASPKDYLIKVDTDGEFVTAFNSGGSVALPSDDVEGLAVIGDYLYASEMSSGGQQYGGPTGKIYKIAKATGAADSNFDLPAPCNQGPCYDGIGGLGTNDQGDELIVALTASCYQCGQNEFYSLDPDNPNNVDQIMNITATNAGAIEEANDFYYVAQQGQLFKYEDTNQGWNTVKSDGLAGVSDITGLAYIDTTMYLAFTDGNSGTGKVRGVTLDENIPELTIIGSYTSTLAASGTGFSTTDTSSSFAIAKATSSTVAVTSPTSGFSVFTKAMPITGTVNDPAVETVSVGVDLPFTELFKDAADDGATSTGKMNATGMWNAACESDNGDVKADSGTCSWYYGQTNNMNYDNGAQNSGTLQLKEAISIVSADVSFTFDTWWDTEPGLDYDRKIVEVSENGSSWTTVAAILGPWDIDQGTGNPWYTPSALSGVQQWLTVPQANMGGMQFSNNFDPYAMCPPNCGNQGNQGGDADPVWESVEVDLSAYVGKTIYIRFSFDTMDAYVN